jgi:uncharacterized protein YbbC (DUF1343 family)
MVKNIFAQFIFLVIVLLPTRAQQGSSGVICGADRITMYKPAMKNKVVALVANHTSMVNGVNLLDTLLKIGTKVGKVFCPEHGFRGSGNAGEYIKNSRDVKTGIPIISLYGKKKKPTAEDLKGIDVVVYDLQDVGVRYYTYISTLTYVMQACAENFIPLFILDRPNPNGFYVDGPVLQMKYKSFVGMHPIPLVYGMTVGEFANMVNEEGWLGTKEKCSIGVITCKNYTHKTLYELPVHPSPNLQDMRSVYLYPSLGLFEGTVVNVGRGTEFPFEVYGNPWMQNCTFTYTPNPIPGVCTDPQHKGLLCNGVDLRDVSIDELTQNPKLNISYLISAYKNIPNKKVFFNSFFENLCGVKDLRQQITDSIPEEQIRESWKADLDSFKIIRKKYLLYPDFE